MHLANYLREKRQRQGVSLGELARRIGYSNICKGCRRLDQFERTGHATRKDLPQRMGLALGVGDDVVQRLAWLDYADWQAWLNEPVPMRLIVRWLPGIYVDEAVPADVRPDAAERWASKVAIEQHRQVCLVVSRRLSIWFDEKGAVVARTETQAEEPNVPTAKVGGRPFEIGRMMPPSPSGEGG